MSNIQDEILKMASSRDNQDNCEDMTDRELKTYEMSMRAKVRKLNDEKGKRKKEKNVVDSASKYSSERK